MHCIILYMAARVTMEVNVETRLWKEKSGVLGRWVVYGCGGRMLGGEKIRTFLEAKHSISGKPTTADSHRQHHQKT